MPGPLALLGSGEFLPVMEALDRELLDGRPHRVVHLPTAAGREGPDRIGYWANLARDHYGRLDVYVETLEVIDRPGAMRVDLAAEISQAGMIFLSGGDPHHVVETLVDTPVWAAIVAAWTDGAALVGCSAGAMAIGGVIPAFRRSAAEALGLLPEISVIPHYDHFGRFMKPAVRMRDRDVTLVGIDENTAIHGGPERWTVYGMGSAHVTRAGELVSYAPGDQLTLP